MNAISRMSPPQVGHASGNSSPTRAMSFAHAIREKSWPQRDEPVQSLTSPPVDFDLSQLGDDLLGQFFVSA